MNTVDSEEQILSNVLRFDSYRTSTRSSERQFYVERLRLGKIFLVARYKSDFRFCPSRFAGYKNNTMAKHLAFEYKSGSVTTPRISSVLKQTHKQDHAAEKRYVALCNDLSAEPSTKPRTYWDMPVTGFPAQALDLVNEAEPDFPDEVSGSSHYAEGAVTQILVNAYERNPLARKACISHFGVACTVCSFNFEETYGVLGSGFTHVHHLTPLALQAKEYKVDPLKDLRPVCPNCHAMLHRSSPPFTIDELKELVEAHQSAVP